MKIMWFVAPLEQDGEQITSDSASVCLRCLVPSYEMEAGGQHQVYLVHLVNPLNFDESILPETDVVVFGKILRDWEPLYRVIDGQGKPMVFDLCDDDIFHQEHLKKACQSLIQYQSHVVCASQELAQTYLAQNKGACSVIPDVVESESAPSQSSASAIASQWLDVFDGVVGKPELKEILVGTPELEQTLAGNCLYVNYAGHKKEGCIHVTVAGELEQTAAVDDTRYIGSFEENYADMIVVEDSIESILCHDARAAISEWLRVLKPGGQFVIEAVNIIHACQRIIHDPFVASQADDGGKNGVWQLYGNPTEPGEGDRLWGYTPHSLSMLLIECGLINVSQVDENTLAKKNGDNMRFVAYKPGL